MKTRTITLIASGIIVALLLGAFAINVFAPAKDLKLKVKWKPNTILLDTGYPNPWIAEVYFAPPENLAQVNTASVRLEHTYALPPGSVPYITNSSRLALPFDGYDVLSAIWAKMTHMTPGEYRVGLEITGNMLDGRAFSGTGYINATIPEPNGP